MDCFENTVKACLGLHPTNTALEAIEVLVVGVDLRNAQPLHMGDLKGIGKVQGLVGGVEIQSLAGGLLVG